MFGSFLAPSVDLSAAPAVNDYLHRYGAQPERFGPAAVSGERDHRQAGHHGEPDGTTAATVARPVKVDNELYVRDYARCLLCYKCVEACGVDAQNTFAIAVAGRGFDARIATEFAVPLPDSACVYCGTVSACVQPAPSCFAVSMRCVSRKPGMRTNKRRRIPSARTVELAAR